MSDIEKVKEGADKVRTFWNRAGEVVSTYPRTAMAVALAVVVVVIWLAV